MTQKLENRLKQCKIFFKIIGHSSYFKAGADPGTSFDWGSKLWFRKDCRTFFVANYNHFSQRRPLVSQSVNASHRWRGKYCFASRRKHIIEGYPKTITFFSNPGIWLSGKMQSRVSLIQPVKKWCTMPSIKEFQSQTCVTSDWGAGSRPRRPDPLPLDPQLQRRRFV